NVLYQTNMVSLLLSASSYSQHPAVQQTLFRCILALLERADDIHLRRRLTGLIRQIEPSSLDKADRARLLNVIPTVIQQTEMTMSSKKSAANEQPETSRPPYKKLQDRQDLFDSVIAIRRLLFYCTR